MRVLRGDVDAGLRQSEAALALLRSVPSRRFHLPIRIALVGRAREAAGDVRGALALFDSALAAAAETGERWYEAEMLRLRAEPLLAAGDADGAEQSLELALATAHRQDARLGELRSAVAIAPLLVRRGRSAHARALLTSIHDWFTEGLDAPDLQHARTLLARLAG